MSPSGHGAMKQRPLLLVVAGFFFTTLLASGSPRNLARSSLYKFPLTFEENRGQADDQFDYVARGPGYGLYLSGLEVLLGLRHGSSPGASVEVLRMRLKGGLAAPSVRPLEPVATKSHYYRGNDPSQWVTNVPHHKRIRYSEVYPGVDLVFYGTSGNLEYDFIVSPGASWEQIRLQFEGVDDLSISPNGHLVLKLKNGEIVQPPPTIYQESQNGERLPIGGSYVLAGSREVAFRVKAYDRSRPLIIDPEVLYLGYLGGSTFTDDPRDIATDSTGAAYVTGQTFSSDFPASIGSLSGSSDAYVAKINAQGTAIDWAAFFGGTSDDWGNAIAVDASQQVYFCGATESSDLATVKAYQGSLEGTDDAFVAMLSSTGSSLIYASYLGGATEPGFSFRTEGCHGIDVDNSLIYIGGLTNTSDFDTMLGAFDTNGPLGSGSYEDDDDAFISVFDPSLSGASSLLYSTYLGSQQGSDIIYDLAVIAAGEVAVTGSTSVMVAAQPGLLVPAGETNTPFPTTTDAFQTTFQGGNSDYDAFVTRLDTTALPAAALIYSTFFGSTSFDDGHSIDVLGDDAYVLGVTDASGTGFPTTIGAYQTSSGGGGELFIAQFDTSGSPGPEPAAAPAGTVSTLIFSTLYGGSDYDSPGGIAVNSSGETFILADTTSSDIPLANAFQSTFEGNVESSQLVVASFNSTGTTLDFASYLGGGEDFASGGIVLAPNGDMLIAATSAAFGLATSGSFDETLDTGGETPNPGIVPSGLFGQDGIVARIGEPADLDLEVTDSPDPVIAGANLTYSITVSNLGTAAATNTMLTVSIFQSTFVSSTGTCAENSGVVTCDVGTIPAPPPPGPAPAGASSPSFDLVLKVDPFFDGSTVSHTFAVAADPFDTDLSNNSVLVDTTVDFEADLAVTKTDSADPVTQGDTFDYTVTVTNNGPSGVFDVRLTDDIPSEVSFNSSDPDDNDEICFYDPKGQQLLCTFFQDVAPGDSVEVTINVTAGPGPATATNTASARTIEFPDDPTPGNDSVNEDTAILGLPDLTVSVTDDPDPVIAGQNLTYNVTVMNPGTAAATSTVLDVTLDAGLSYVSGSQPAPVAGSLQGTVVCTPNGSSVSCDLGTIAAQGSKPVSIVTSVDPGQTAALSSQFDVSTVDTESNDSNNGATEGTTVTTSTDLSITKSDSPDPVITGETLTYLFTATNNGPSDATGVVVTDTLPAGVTYLSSNPSICSQDEDLFCNIGSLSAEQSSQFTVDVTVNAAPGQLSNSAAISGSQSDPIGGNDSAVELTTVDPAIVVDLTVAVTDLPDPVVAGTDLTYNVTVMNEGSGEATNSVLDVTLGAGLSLESAGVPRPVGISIQGAVCTPAGNSVSCSLGTIPAEGASFVSIVASVDPGQTAALSSQFDVSTDQDEISDLNNSATANTSVTTSADLSISKTDSVDPVGTGDALTYTLTATNSGPSNASEVVVQDTLPEGVNLSSSSPSCSLDGDLVCSLGNLTVGQSMQVTATVGVEAVPGTTLTNSASISGAQDDPATGNNSTVESTEVELTADLAVELTHSPEIPFFGLPMNILATFRNLGPDAAYSGTVNIVLPSNFTVDSVGSDFSCSTLGNQILCNFGVFQPGESASASIAATPAQGGDFTISGSIQSLSTDLVSGNDSDEIMFNIPDDLDLSIVKTPRFDVAAVGRPFWYEIEIENLGNGPLVDIQVTDELTAGLQVNGVTTEDSIDCTEAPASISCVVEALNPGETVAFLLEVQVGEGLLGPFLNTVEAAAEGDQDTENNSSTAAAVGAAPGDMNADGAFDAADVVLLVLEINDGDGDEVFESAGGTFKGNPAMDVDGDGLITLADYDALLSLIFPPSGTP